MLLADGAVKIINRFENAGFSAYVTGGTVRDLMMGREPKEYHISTDAKPYVIKSLFPHTVDSAQKYGTLTIIEGGRGYEVSTLRNDGVYTPHKRSDKVVFTQELAEDLAHRDFTINAMAYNPTNGLCDPFGGTDDIKNKRIRCVGDAAERFSEDAGRMLRAMRFAATLGFEIDENTLLQIRKYGVMIKKSGAELIRTELTKILLSENTDSIKLLHEAGLLKHIMPELDTCFSVEQRNKYHIHNVGDHILAAVSNTPPDYVLRWAALFHDIGKPCCQSVDQAGIIHFYGHHRESVRIANDIMHRFHFDSDTIQDICLLVENHDVRIEPSPLSVKHMLARCGEELFGKLLILQEADNRGKNPKYLADKLRKLTLVNDMYNIIITEHQPYKTSDLVINSRDLIKCGFRAGREIVDALRALLDEVLIDPSLNNRDYLLRRVKQIKSKRGKNN